MYVGKKYVEAPAKTVATRKKNQVNKIPPPQKRTTSSPRGDDGSWWWWWRPQTGVAEWESGKLLLIMFLSLFDKVPSWVGRRTGVALEATRTCSTLRLRQLQCHGMGNSRVSVLGSLGSWGAWAKSQSEQLMCCHPGSSRPGYVSPPLPSHPSQLVPR